MTSAAGVCTAWAQHFLAACDEDVQHYVSQALLAAHLDGELITEHAELLHDFVPASFERQALIDKLKQLEVALSGSHSGFCWLDKPAPSPAAIAQPLLESHGAAGLSPSAEVLPVISADQRQSQPGMQRNDPRPINTGSTLSISAAEFTPGQPASSALAPVLPKLEALQLDEARGTAGNQVQGSWASADSQQYSTAPQHADPWTDCSQAVGDGSCSTYGDWRPDDADDSSQVLQGGPGEQAAFLSVLAEQFPLFSEEALQQLFEEQNCSLSATIQTLCSLEAEVQGQQAAQPAPSVSAHTGPSFTADDFPSLGGPSPSTSIGRSPAHASTSGAYASKARDAASLPGDHARRSAGARARASPSGALPAQSAPAPIWQAQDVQQFATGQALAAQYAELRADARDHARLRNAYFQQATQAYLAGDRRLARELGAKGRWHGEQMHAAHAAAAAELFARRNAGMGRAGPSSGGGDVRTVDLHGLHVREALQQLEALLPSIRSSRQRMRLVVGQGTHGKVPARLPVAVRRWLQEQGLRYSEPYVGLLEVDL